MWPRSNNADAKASTPHRSTEKGTGCFTRYGQVVGKIQSATLGCSIWPFVGQRPWELVYFLTSVRHVRVPKAELVGALGHSPVDRVAGSTADRVRERCGAASRRQVSRTH